MGQERDQDSLLTTRSEVLWTLSHLLNPLPCCPKFHFMHQRKPRPKEKKFSSHWSGIQEFIFLKVLSQAKLCYLGVLPKCRSVLFWIMKPLVVTLFPDISDEKQQYMMCFTKEGCQVCCAFNLVFLVIWTLTFSKKGRWDAQGCLLLNGIHVLVDWQPSDQPPSTSSSLPQMSHHLFFLTLQCSLITPPGYTAETGHVSGQPITGRVSEGAVANYHWTLL